MNVTSGKRKRESDSHFSSNETPPLKQQKIETQQEKDSSKDDEDDLFDMFGDDEEALPEDSSILFQAATPIEEEAITRDDKEGYYRIQVGEQIKKYVVLDIPIGRGVFSDVIAAEHQETGQKVAIKILRNREGMKKSGMTEISNIQRIWRVVGSAAGTYLVNILEHFVYRQHLCIVYEHLKMNMREVINSFGKEKGGRRIGINIKAIRLYLKQLLTALNHLRESEIIHADIKPDNILINEANTHVKLADFGSSFTGNEAFPTPYLQSRFYRAPEIILGHPYSYEIDLWSLGCTAFELFTGNVLFQSESNNDHLKLIMEYKGAFSEKFLQRAQFKDKHFDENNSFLLHQRDLVDPDKLILKRVQIREKKSLRNVVVQYLINRDLQSKYEIYDFADLLEKMLKLNPPKRISIQDALEHPFIIGNYEEEEY